MKPSKLRKKKINLFCYKFFNLIFCEKTTLTIFANSSQKKERDNTKICFTFSDFDKSHAILDSFDILTWSYQTIFNDMPFVIINLIVGTEYFVGN